MANNDFGSRTLKRGVTGTDVEVLQHYINNLPDSIVGPVVVDGVFGANTETAVKQFQKNFGLLADGIVGKDTFLYFGEQTGSYLPAGAVQFGSRNLRKGSVGRDVWVLQNRLASTAKKYANLLNGPADSKFGSKTEAAVKAFQKDFGLVQDGIVGPDTFFQLYVYTGMGGRYLQRSNRTRNKGYDVYFLQVHLKEKGYYSGVLDGEFGSLTESAVKNLQKAAGITVDGVVGPQTYYYLGL